MTSRSKNSSWSAEKVEETGDCPRAIDEKDEATSAHINSNTGAIEVENTRGANAISPILGRRWPKHEGRVQPVLAAANDPHWRLSTDYPVLSEQRRLRKTALVFSLLLRREILEEPLEQRQVLFLISKELDA